MPFGRSRIAALAGASSRSLSSSRHDRAHLLHSPGATSRSAAAVIVVGVLSLRAAPPRAARAGRRRCPHGGRGPL